MKRKQSTGWMAAAALCAGLGTFALSADAHACGGLFCSGPGPQSQVNQAAERIIFADNPDGSVTALVQIMYQGSSDQFAWLLPVPGMPEVGVSSNRAFTTLQTRTNPQYTMNTSVEGDCKSARDSVVFAPASADASSPENAGAPDDTGGVEVLDEGTAGPYDWTLIQVDMQLENRVQVALDWLDENGYYVTDIGPDVIEPYLDEGMNLLAFKLTKNSDTGDIRPVRLRYDSDVPMIPIKLTAVAANDDMGVLVWVLGEHRAVPVNYKSLEINDAILNWFNPGPSYNNVINVAADESGGQGFVTEYADATEALGKVIFTANDEEMWRELQAENWEGGELQLLDRVVAFYGQGGWDGVGQAIDAAFPRLSADQKARVEECGSCAFENQALPEDFSVETFLTAVDDWVVAPVRETQELLESRPFVTRFYTTLSAAEMTVDPVFDFNPDLGNVSNVHTAERIIECSKNVTQFEAPWRAELPSGLVVRGTGPIWPFTPGDSEMPTNIAVRQTGTSGEGTIVQDNVEAIRRVLDEHNASIVGPGGCGCRTNGAGSAPASLLALLGLAGFVVIRRRKARR